MTDFFVARPFVGVTVRTTEHEPTFRPFRFEPATLQYARLEGDTVAVSFALDGTVRPNRDAIDLRDETLPALSENVGAAATGTTDTPPDPVDAAAGTVVVVGGELVVVVPVGVVGVGTDAGTVVVVVVVLVVGMGTVLATTRARPDTDCSAVS